MKFFFQLKQFFFNMKESKAFIYIWIVSTAPQLSF